MRQISTIITPGQFVVTQRPGRPNRRIAVGAGMRGTR